MGEAWKTAVRIAATLGLILEALFGSAGTLAWPRGWLWLALYVGQTVVILSIVRRTNPELIAARSTAHRGTKPFDRLIMAAWTPTMLAIPVVGGLDAVRFGWAPLPAWTTAIGAVLMVLAAVPLGWSMAVNRHLETTVRIQQDRGHEVCDRGPYAYVRHPMYVGVLLGNLAFPLIVGSSWAYAPVAVGCVIFLIRTTWEDRTLHAELPGYAAFAQRTRYRLLPGVW